MIANRVIWRNEALDDPEVPLPDELPLADELAAGIQEAEVIMFPWINCVPLPAGTL
jgi:hypothetical protein